MLAVLSLAACGRPDVSITADPTPPATVASPRRAPGAPPSPSQGLPPANAGVLPPGAGDKVLPAGAKPIVRVLEPGGEPRSDLSYALSKGSTRTVVMSMDLAMAVKSQGQALPPASLPRMGMTLEAATVDKSPAGEFKIDSHLTGVSLDPNGAQQEQVARALRPQLDSLKGLSMAYWVNPKGHVRDVKLGVPSGVPQAAQQLLNGMSQSFESMVTPLPAEPVGVGARWQVITRTANGGADLLQSAVYTLKARDGAKATLEVSLMQLSANDTIRTPQMPAGMSAKVRSFSSSGAGTTVLDLKSVAPDSGTLTLKVAMEIAVQGPGAAGESSTVETTTTVRINRP
jgi:hypothetical protein